MKFRIIRYYERFKPQVLSETNDREWCDLGEPTGYPTPESAEEVCLMYKQRAVSRIVKEFEL